MSGLSNASTRGLGKHIAFLPFQFDGISTNLGLDHAHRGADFIWGFCVCGLHSYVLSFFKDKTSKANLAPFVPRKQGLLVHKLFTDPCHTDELRRDRIPQGVRRWHERPSMKSGLEQRQKEVGQWNKMSQKLRLGHRAFWNTVSEASPWIHGFGILKATWRSKSQEMLLKSPWPKALVSSAQAMQIPTAHV